MCADVSQSFGRNGTCVGVLPVITPRAEEVVIGPLGRTLAPAEKLMAHGFPLQRMKRPVGIRECDLGRLGGNTMELRCVATAMLIGMRMIHVPTGRAPAAGNARTFTVEVAFALDAVQ
jgi:hypothetical protein